MEMVVVEVVVVVVAGSWWLRLMVAVDRVWERFRSISGDAASAEPQRYLFSQWAQQSSTRGVAVKRGLIVAAGSRVFESVK